MKLQILPNWCKKLGLILFFVTGFINGFQSFIDGFNDGFSGKPYDYKPTYFENILGESGLHFLGFISMIGLIIFLLSKEKIEDDFINKLRLESYQLTSFICLVLFLILYAFTQSMKISFDDVIFVFVTIYAITFYIKKRIY